MTALLDRPAPQKRPVLVDKPELLDRRALLRRPTAHEPWAIAGSATDTGPAPARLRPARMAPPRLRPVPVPGGGVAEPTALRLTRRARLLCTTATLAGLLLVTGVAAANAGDPTVAAPSGATVVVAPGDTLWQLAVEMAPDADTAEVVRRLRVLNGLGSGPIQPGQVLAVPGR